MPKARAPSAWLESLFLDLTECAWSRARPQNNAPSLADTSFPAPLDPVKPSLQGSRIGSPRSFTPYPEFFERLAYLVVDDPLIAVRIADDRTSPLIWGETSCPRAEFLQMCIRDRHMKCLELWWKLDEKSRRELLEVYRNGAPSTGYFYEIMVAGHDRDKATVHCGSSDHDSVSFTSSNIFRLR